MSLRLLQAPLENIPQLMGGYKSHQEACGTQSSPLPAWPRGSQSEPQGGRTRQPLSWQMAGSQVQVDPLLLYAAGRWKVNVHGLIPWSHWKPQAQFQCFQWWSSSLPLWNKTYWTLIITLKCQQILTESKQQPTSGLAGAVSIYPCYSYVDKPTNSKWTLKLQTFTLHLHL